jgi:hypothetical protein
MNRLLETVAGVCMVSGVIITSGITYMAPAPVGMSLQVERGNAGIITVEYE